MKEVLIVSVTIVVVFSLFMLGVIWLAEKRRRAKGA
jgi:hypothetical protein